MKILRAEQGQVVEADEAGEGAGPFGEFRPTAVGQRSGARRLVTAVAELVLRLLGTGMIAGYLSERFSRRLLTPAGFDPVETPIVTVGLAGALAMAVVGARRQAGR